MWRGPACPVPHARESVEHRLKTVAEGTSSETPDPIDVTIYRHATEGGLLNGLLSLGVGCSRNHRAPSERGKHNSNTGPVSLGPRIASTEARLARDRQTNEGESS
jgi:hypothetical protein